MNFKEWLVKEYGTKITATGLNSAGMAQHGGRYRMSIRPAKPVNIKIKPIRRHSI